MENVRELISQIEPNQLVQLAIEFDRLNGTNVMRKGAPIELLIDSTTGKLDADDQAFCEFIIDILQRIPKE